MTLYHYLATGGVALAAMTVVEPEASGLAGGTFEI